MQAGRSLTEADQRSRCSLVGGSGLVLAWFWPGSCLVLEVLEGLEVLEVLEVLFLS